MGLLGYADEQTMRNRRRRNQVENQDKVMVEVVRTRGLGYFRPFGPQTEVDVSHGVRVNQNDRTFANTMQKSADIFDNTYSTSARIMKGVAELPDKDRL